MVPFVGENGGGVKIQLKFDAFTAAPGPTIPPRPTAHECRMTNSTCIGGVGRFIRLARSQPDQTEPVVNRTGKSVWFPLTVKTVVRPSIVRLNDASQRLARLILLVARDPLLVVHVSVRNKEFRHFLDKLCDRLVLRNADCNFTLSLH